MKGQLSRTAHCLAETVCTHEQALAVLGAGFMKCPLLQVRNVMRKFVLGRTLRLQRLKPSYGGLGSLQRRLRSCMTGVNMTSSWLSMP